MVAAAVAVVVMLAVAVVEVAVVAAAIIVAATAVIVGVDVDVVAAMMVCTQTACLTRSTAQPLKEHLHVARSGHAGKYQGEIRVGLVGSSPGSTATQSA